MQVPSRALEDYIGYWENLTPRSVRLIEKLADPAIRFTDPFNDVQGVEAVEAIINKMFAESGAPKFRVTDSAWGRDGYTAYIRWVFTFLPKGKNEVWEINGISEVMFNTEGKAVSHIDHWDSGSQILGRIPVLSWIFGKVREKLGI